METIKTKNALGKKPIPTANRNHQCTQHHLDETTERTQSMTRAGKMITHAKTLTQNCIRAKFAHANAGHVDFQEKEMETHMHGTNQTRKPPETFRDTLKKCELTRGRHNSKSRTRRNPCVGTLPVATDNSDGPTQTNAQTDNHTPLCSY